VKIGVVGLGYWGPNLVRNFLSTEGIRGVVCYDMQEKHLQRIKKRFPSVELAQSFEDLLKDPEVEAVSVVTPVSTHYLLGIKVLEAGKHLLMEKPMARTVSEAEDMVERAQKKGLVLMVDHTFVYTGAVRKIKEVIDRGEIGDILYMDSVRVNLGLFQHDVNVVWDLAPHDLSIMDYLIKQRPTAVSAVGVDHYNSGEDTAYLTVHFGKKLLAHFHVNWLSPVKIRRILLAGSKQMIVYDDMESSEKVKIYNKGVDIKDEDTVYATLVQYRMGDMYAPQVPQTEALSLLIQEFIECIKSDKRPITDGHAGLNVVRILEAAEKSLRSRGSIVEL